MSFDYEKLTVRHLFIGGINVLDKICDIQEKIDKIIPTTICFCHDCVATYENYGLLDLIREKMSL